MTYRSVFVLLALVASLLVGVEPGAAQQLPSPDQLQNLSREQILQRIRASGLTEAQIRDQLRRAGYDPALADRYFGEGAAEEGLQTGPRDLEFVEALSTIGISLRPDSLAADSLRMGRDTLLAPADSLEEARDSAALPVFGRELFRRVSRGFEPSLTGPVGPSYPLGPGDEVILILTGDVELAYRLDVTREGYLFIPDVGQVFVNGLTLGDLEDRLYDRLGQVYSGIGRGGDATTRFSISLGRLRANQVYVIGEVERPGSYRLSALATPLEALYLAGGPRESGSFRRVVVRRAGEVAGSFDLYRFLTAGVTPMELRLQEGDVVFVPPVGAQVALLGEVVRPARYEVLEGEDLEDLVRYAGGLRSSGRAEAVRVDRILPPSQRAQGRDRAVLTADLHALESAPDSFPLQGGDSVTVFPLLEELRGWVEIEGGVYRPGRYELRDGSTVASLVERAGGALPDVFDPIAHVSSLDRTDGSRSLLRMPLDRASDIRLREFDIVRLFAVDSLLQQDSVAVFGLVRAPGRYPLAEGTTAEDLILMAGGMVYGADPRRAEIARTSRGDLDATVEGRETFAVLLPADLPYPGPAARDSLPPPPGTLRASASVPLISGDEVYVRQLPGYGEAKRVEMLGEVRFPGTYVLRSEEDRVSDLIRRAGGLTSEAYAPGFRLVRDGLTVGVDLREAMERSRSPVDPTLRARDRLVVPSFDPTVVVRGAVAFESRVLFHDGMDLDEAIAQAGGLTPEADKGRITVEYANGSRAIVSRHLGINFGEPDVEPGSIVIVPAMPEAEAGFDWDTALSRVLAVASTLATVIIATR